MYFPQKIFTCICSGHVVEPEYSIPVSSLSTYSVNQPVLHKAIVIVLILFITNLGVSHAVTTAADGAVSPYSKS